MLHRNFVTEKDIDPTQIPQIFSQSLRSAGGFFGGLHLPNGETQITVGFVGDVDEFPVVF